MGTGPIKGTEGRINKTRSDCETGMKLQPKTS
jgi:hypothetical protein